MINKIKKIVIFGSGPISIGQACEFDYSGTQACKALMEKGYEVILINSNPATIMTDPNIATRVYIEPLRPGFVEKILEKEKPEAVLANLGGQTGLNLALDLDKKGILKKLNIKLLGSTIDVIELTENRLQFNKMLNEIGAKHTKSFLIHSFKEGLQVLDQLKFPIVHRANYTLGGGGSAVTYSLEEYKVKLALALNESPSSEVLVEQSIYGWKEFELEIMRDQAGTFVVVCSIENLDPCGVHTGDSITVAPQQTLSDEEYQAMRTEAFKIVERIGLTAGGANIQFAIHPNTKERLVIEVNPRVSRSSALASKATGFPIAKIAALLSIGYLLEDIQNDITQKTVSCYEPSLDYIVVKAPFFNFEKFAGVKDELGTQMKSVGEAMGVGRSFKEALQATLLSLEHHNIAFPEVVYSLDKLSKPNSKRIYHIMQAFREGLSVSEVQKKTWIASWFLEQIYDLCQTEKKLKLLTKTENKKIGIFLKQVFSKSYKIKTLDGLLERYKVDSRLGSSGSEFSLNKFFNLMIKAKQEGFSDKAIADSLSVEEELVRDFRWSNNIRPFCFNIDTCSGEFEAVTPYFYFSYNGSGHDSIFTKKEKTILILGSGPNRIGQSIEFDYNCVKSIQALQAQGYKVAMANSNPETVSTDYDTSDYLFFSPLQREVMIELVQHLQPQFFLYQCGGQTALNLAFALEKYCKPLGASLDVIQEVEDRERFYNLCKKNGFNIPLSLMASEFDEAQNLMQKKDLKYPIICRPSYVLGGRRMEIVESHSDLKNYFHKNKSFISKTNPCLIDEFLSNALEIDMDIICGKNWSVVGGILEHIESAGVHSGDSMAVIPPQRLKPELETEILNVSSALPRSLGMRGFLNLQIAIKQDKIYLLEANPRTSRSLPFIAKAMGKPLFSWGVMGLLGFSKEEVMNVGQNSQRHSSASLRSAIPSKKRALNLSSQKYLNDFVDFSSQTFKQKVCVKGLVFPFKKLEGSDFLLGPEMKSTGESMGRGDSFAEALYKALAGAYIDLPLEGEIFLSWKNKDKKKLLFVAQTLQDMGYHLSATKGTSLFLKEHGVVTKRVHKLYEGKPNCVDRIRSQKVQMVINTPSPGGKGLGSSRGIRRSCIDYFVPCITEDSVAQALIFALQYKRNHQTSVEPLEKESDLYAVECSSTPCL